MGTSASSADATAGGLNKDEILSSAKLAPIITQDKLGEPVAATSLWKDHAGAVVMEEAAELTSKLKPELDQINMRLIGVLHETFGADEFQRYMKGSDLFFDEQKVFFKQILGDRWLGAKGFFDSEVHANLKRARAKGVSGNMKGEGRLLGGLLVVTGNKIVFEHREKVWGSHADGKEVLEVCKKVAAAVAEAKAGGGGESKGQAKEEGKSSAGAVSSAGSAGSSGDSSSSGSSSSGAASS